MTHHSKIIAVIGGTGAQGMPVVEALLAPSPDGSPSPWRVRVLTRDPEHKRAVHLKQLGAELVKGDVIDLSLNHLFPDPITGSFGDFPVVSKLFDGVYGAFVNTDGFSVGEVAELHIGVRIYELARSAKVKHYVWSSLDYALKKGNWDPRYLCDHFDSKGRV